VYIKQIAQIVSKLLDFISPVKNKSENPITSTIPEFSNHLEIDHLNLFKLINFLKETKLANKVGGPWFSDPYEASRIC
jgi:hypothetical protein